MIRFSRIGIYSLAALLMAAASPVRAAEESFVMADASSSQPRFISLDSARQGRAAVRAIHGTGVQATALRSDRVAMNNGFMRIDRAQLTPVRSYRNMHLGAVKKTPVAVTRGTASTATTEDAEITSLFDGGVNESVGFEQSLRQTGGRIRHAWPLPVNVEQKFTSGYGSRKDPFHGRQAFHGGIDLAAKVGTPVLASAEGIVKRVETQRGLGKFVSVQHRDGTESFYGHLSAQNVRVGQRVMQGQKVGALGSTGRSTGPHLDYRIKRNGQTFNPMLVLRAPAATGIRVASR
jgi:murein DD-endopeptidase MepM/ murein hydrolase activator NlpD